ncbi:hypothetical protein GCM10027355_25870 [Haloplanus salinarum]
MCPGGQGAVVSTQPTVLHVDDDRSVLDLSSERANDAAVTWLTASDPADGLTTLTDRDVDCLVSDSIRTDGGTPFVVRAADVDPDLPVVLFTAADRESIPGATHHVATRHVEKETGDAFATLLDHVAAVVPMPGDARVDDPDTTNGSGIAPRPERRAAGPDRSGAWVPIERYEWRDESTDLATTIVTAVEEYTGRDASAPPLYESIDAEMLEALLSRPDGDSRSGIQVRFFFADQELAVTSEGLILLRTETGGE